MQFENLQAIIDFAIEREKEAHVFYTELSREESMSGAKEMLLEFAKEEKKHAVLLESIGTEDAGKALEDYKWKWITDIKRSDYVVEMEYKKGMAYHEILMVAMKREEKALALYNELLRQSEDDSGKKIFKMLCQEEAKHKLALETKYDDYMAEMGD